MAAEHKRRKAERFADFLKAHEEPSADRLTELHSKSDEWNNRPAPLSRSEGAEDLRESYTAPGAVLKRVRCSGCGRTGTFYGAGWAAPGPDHLCPRCTPKEASR